jgi:hypothetical protein
VTAPGEVGHSKDCNNYTLIPHDVPALHAPDLSADFLSGRLHLWRG